MNERDFFKNPFNRAEIDNLLQGRPASEMFNFKSPSFKMMGLDRTTLTDGDLVELMLKEPRLIRRPVVKIGDQVYFGADSTFLEGLVS